MNKEILLQIPNQMFQTQNSECDKNHNIKDVEQIIVQLGKQIEEFKLKQESITCFVEYIIQLAVDQKDILMSMLHEEQQPKMENLLELIMNYILNNDNQFQDFKSKLSEQQKQKLNYLIQQHKDLINSLSEKICTQKSITYQNDDQISPNKYELSSERNIFNKPDYNNDEYEEEFSNQSYPIPQFLPNSNDSQNNQTTNNSFQENQQKNSVQNIITLPYNNYNNQSNSKITQFNNQLYQKTHQFENEQKILKNQKLTTNQYEEKLNVNQAKCKTFLNQSISKLTQPAQNNPTNHSDQVRYISINNFQDIFDQNKNEQFNQFNNSNKNTILSENNQHEITSNFYQSTSKFNNESQLLNCQETHTDFEKFQQSQQKCILEYATNNSYSQQPIQTQSNTNSLNQNQSQLTQNSQLNFINNQLFQHQAQSYSVMGNEQQITNIQKLNFDQDQIQQYQQDCAFKNASNSNLVFINQQQYYENNLENNYYLEQSQKQDQNLQQISYIQFKQSQKNMYQSNCNQVSNQLGMSICIDQLSTPLFNHNTFNESFNQSSNDNSNNYNIQDQNKGFQFTPYDFKEQQINENYQDNQQNYIQINPINNQHQNHKNMENNNINNLTSKGCSQEAQQQYNNSSQETNRFANKQPMYVLMKKCNNKSNQRKKNSDEKRKYKNTYQWIFKSFKRQLQNQKNIKDDIKNLLIISDEKYEEHLKQLLKKLINDEIIAFKCYDSFKKQIDELLKNRRKQQTNIKYQSEDYIWYLKKIWVSLSDYMDQRRKL